MHTVNHPKTLTITARILFIMALSFSLVTPARASLPFEAAGHEAIPQANQPPMAMDDSGPGFTTTQHRAFSMANVLGNDSDPDEDALFVKSFDTGDAKGSITLINPLAEGSLDTSLGVTGTLTIDYGGNITSTATFALQPDSKILIEYTVGNSSALARYNADGSLDDAFGSNGKADPGFTSRFDSTGIALQPDGKIIVSGMIQDQSQPPYSHVALARFNPDGKLDAGFGKGGRITSISGIASPPLVLPDNKIIYTVIAENYLSKNANRNIPAIPPCNFSGFVVRLNPDGSYDSGFGSGGIRTVFANECSFINALSLRVDGQSVILISHFNFPSHAWFDLMLLNPAGDLDCLVCGDNTIPTNYYFGVAALAFRSDGTIVVVGTTDGYSFGVARFNPDGSLDPLFGNGGLVTTSFAGVTKGTSAAFQTDGKIVVAGFTNSDTSGSGLGDFALARYNPDGSLDTGFGSGGKITTKFAASVPGKSVVIQSDDKIIEMGINGTEFAVARFNAGGTFRYDPIGQFDWLAPGQQAFDTFTYVVSDGVLTDTATVTITVNGVTQVFLPVVSRP